jgi:hypothetical protein
VWLVIYMLKPMLELGFMSVNGNTGIYGNVVLTLRLQFRPSRFNRVRFLRVPDTGALMTGGGCGW